MFDSRVDDLPPLSLSFFICKMGFRVSAAGVAVHIKGHRAGRAPGMVSGVAGILKRGPVFWLLDRHRDKAHSPGQ